MKTDTQIRSLAKQIVVASQKEGQIDRQTLLGFIQTLSSSEEGIAQQILAEIERIIDRIEKESTLFIESAFELDKTLLEQVKNYFEKKESRKLQLKFSINKELLGGLRIQLGDFVWEKTILTNLDKLKEAIRI